MNRRRVFAIVNVYFRDLAHLVGIALQLLFYMTPIIYPLTMVDQVWRGIPLVRVLEANPLTSYVALFRNLVYELNAGSLFQWIMVVASSLLMLALAIWVSQTKGADLGENV